MIRSRVLYETVGKLYNRPTSKMLWALERDRNYIILIGLTLTLIRMSCNIFVRLTLGTQTMQVTRDDDRVSYSHRPICRTESISVVELLGLDKSELLETSLHKRLLRLNAFTIMYQIVAP